MFAPAETKNLMRTIRGVAKLLGGPFSPDDPNHAPVAFLLAAAFGERI